MLAEWKACTKFRDLCQGEFGEVVSKSVFVGRGWGVGKRDVLIGGDLFFLFH